MYGVRWILDLSGEYLVTYTMSNPWGVCLKLIYDYMSTVIEK